MIKFGLFYILFCLEITSLLLTSEIALYNVKIAIVVGLTVFFNMQ